MNYVQRTWIDGAFRPDEQSVYREEGSTINDLEGECVTSCSSPAKFDLKNLGI